MSPPRKEILADGVEIWLADCRDVLPLIGRVDAVVTDPVWPNCPAGAISGADDPWGLWATAWGVMPECGRSVTVMRCDSDPRFLFSIPKDLPFFRSIQLPYVIPGYIGRVLGGDETAYWFGSVIKFQRGRQVVPGRAPSAQPSARPPNGHPMSRSQDHFDWLLHWCSDEDELVLDPFTGSGTTGVACVNLGRKFIGIEIEPKYYDIARRRITEALRQTDIFIDKPKPVQQESLL